MELWMRIVEAPTTSPTKCHRKLPTPSIARWRHRTPDQAAPKPLTAVPPRTLSRRAGANFSNLPANAAASGSPSMSEDSDDAKNQRTGPRRTALIVELLCSVNQSSILGYESLQYGLTPLTS
jgi:hypothetical protein